MRIAIVTGVAGGIGKAAAIALAKKGYYIVGMGRNTAPELSDFDGGPLLTCRGIFPLLWIVSVCLTWQLRRGRLGRL